MKECLNCGKEIPTRNKYCNNVCQGEYEYKQKIQEWKDGDFDGIKGKDEVSNHLRRYLFEKFSSRCCKCGWGTINEFTELVPLQVHHIDGDCLNNEEENLELLCPNCHALTKNYGSKNKSSTRTRR